jgi:hypothetical protein
MGRCNTDSKPTLSALRAKGRSRGLIQTENTLASVRSCSQADQFSSGEHRWINSLDGCCIDRLSWHRLPDRGRLWNVYIRSNPSQRYLASSSPATPELRSAVSEALRLEKVSEAAASPHLHRQPTKTGPRVRSCSQHRYGRARLRSAPRPRNPRKVADATTWSVRNFTRATSPVVFAPTQTPAPIRSR